METVVLVHGIWMNGWDMVVLRHRLEQAGFRTVQFSYRSVSHTLQDNTQRLQQFLLSLTADPVHIVAHSLGGLLVRQVFYEFPQLKSGRVVTLGTPHRGSYVAKRITQNRFGRLILGNSIQYGLLGDAPAWSTNKELGVIAGNRGMGVGRMLTRLPKPNDGTVVLEETPLPGMTDYLVVPVNHIGLLFTKSVADQVVHFLRQGVFIRND